MAKSRLALVNCESGDGPWQPVRGDEQAVRVSGLQEGERVCLDAEVAVGSTRLIPIVYAQAGSYPLDLTSATRYRFVKQAKDGVRPSKTCVEVVING